MKWYNGNGQWIEADCPWCGQVGISIPTNQLIDHLCSKHYEVFIGSLSDFDCQMISSIYLEKNK